MSHYMTALAMKQRGLAPATKILLYWLADHHNAETGKCFPSVNRLVKLCEMSKRSVQNHLDALEFIANCTSLESYLAELQGVWIVRTAMIVLYRSEFSLRRRFKVRR